jgi:5-formyltetrahydrofolate cyclo-ligase
MTSKADIRKKIEMRRSTLEAEWIQTASAAVVANLVSMREFAEASSVALYLAIGGELDLDGLIQPCREMNKTICIPVFNRDCKIYELAEITPDTQFKTGHYGIREPADAFTVAVNQIDFMCVPGVAFDANGNRLGRGGGYYDRLLDGFHGYTAGVAFDFQILPKIPVNIHDRPVDALITESGILKV